MGHFSISYEAAYTYSVKLSIPKKRKYSPLKLPCPIGPPRSKIHLSPRCCRMTDDMPAGFQNLGLPSITHAKQNARFSSGPNKKHMCSVRDRIRWMGSAAGNRQTLTRVMMPSLSTSRAGLCGMRRGVDRPLFGGEEPASEDAGYGMELMDLKRPRLSRLPLPTRLSISSARCSVLSFSS